MSNYVFNIIGYVAFVNVLLVYARVILCAIKIMENCSKINVNHLGSILKDQQKPLKQRFRALFTLKEVGGEAAIQQISDCFQDPSALLKHELAYCLGQIQDNYAIPILSKVLADTEEDIIVRHEAAEALGAIASSSSASLLEQYKNDASLEVAQSCHLAIERINLMQLSEHATENGRCIQDNSKFNSIDPAPPFSVKQTNVDVLYKILTENTSNQCLFERYRALFTLRDLATNQSIEALGKALLDCDGALIKHEIAFVLGQLQNESSIPYLIKGLRKISEHEMVRHECAEALGAIATDECTTVLTSFLNDTSRIVRESCEIALDIADYELNPVFLL